MDLTEVRSNAFFGDDVFYDLEERNYLVLESAEDEDAQALGGPMGPEGSMAAQG